MTPRKYNHDWDKLLTPAQRELIAKPGFGLVERLPYLPAEEVQKVMNIIEECVKHLELVIEK